MLRFWQRRKDDPRVGPPSPEGADEGAARAAELEKATFKPGMQIAGKFTLQRLIAAGSMGTVFEAWDMFVERRVAIKLMHPNYDRDPAMIARFRREAQTTAAIQHPNVVTIHEVGQRRDGTFYMVQELLEGESLREYLAPRGRLTEHETMTIMVPIMGALIAAHRRGIVHRDIKPENIVLTDSTSGEIVPKLIDFGLARVNTLDPKRKLTLSGVVMGTPEYMAPEQAKGDPGIDARADVWSVGAVLFELLSGRRPYDGPTHQAVLIKIVTEAPPILSTLVDDIPAAFLEVVQGALVQAREGRYPSMQVFRDKLVFAYENISHRVVLAPTRGPKDEDEDTHEPHEEAEAAYEASGADVLELDPADLVLDEDTVTELDEAIASLASTTIATLPRAEVEWRDAAALFPGAPPTADENAAFDALGVNALRDAEAHAARAIEASGTPETIARMRLVQAIAHRWLGNTAEARRAAEEAITGLPRGSTAYHAALGHLVIASGSMGDVARIGAFVDELAALAREGVTTEAHIVTAARLVIALVRAGLTDRAHEVFAGAQRLAQRHSVVSSFVLAWLDVARVEIALHEGDLIGYVRRVESAVENFTSAGDMRNACLQRCNIGNAYVQLGAYALAVAAFREAQAIAEPMQLDFVSSLLANLGYALAHMENLTEAIAVETAALELLVRQGNRRGEGFVRVYLSIILRLAGRTDEALTMAQHAMEVSEGVPAARACALALIAAIAIARNNVREAYTKASEAMQILGRLEGIEEGESLIQWTYALALRVNGAEEEALRRITEARRRLLKRADRISDPRWRQSFLEQVPDNARVMEFAAIWLGER
ncbi:protein kinase domain-containing protein [Polyangium fumosum]|uniref:Serine/threonine protein kinase n=1 Tax=Polyangium fumosum TaxID=889272 RepID=A0A4U1IY41_9BACT|nr:serine/threonine-protein kinase [Polyangium fumosum]TKC99550.1 serine/threonine protein kinase [Polyangium fumosum]